VAELAVSIDVVRAGRVLFGPAFAVEDDWHGRLRSTYRRRAFETHPDRAGILGREAAELAKEFSELTDAYRLLSGCRRTGRSSSAQAARSPRSPAARAGQAAPPRREEPRHSRPPPGPDTGGPRTRPEGGPGANASRPLPRRRLRFAEFLYYSGRVSFAQLVEAIVWQRRQRPPLGRIAVEFGFLEEEEVKEILARRGRERSASVPFGEFAVRAGFLTPFQLLAALGRQRRLQRPIGEFFVERGLIARDEVAAICRQIFTHNSECLAA